MAKLSLSSQEALKGLTVTSVDGNSITLSDDTCVLLTEEEIEEVNSEYGEEEEGNEDDSEG